jgi:origin recognition complex subunit 5
MKRSQSLLRRPGLVPFIWVHHPHTPSPLLDLPNSSDSIVLDAIEYHTPRLLYSGIVYKLDNAMGEVTTLDALTRALKQVVAMRSTSSSTVKGKRKAREMENGQANGHSAMSHGISITVLHAERLRTVLGTGWTVITRLAELVGLMVVPVAVADSRPAWT